MIDEVQTKLSCGNNNEVEDWGVIFEDTELESTSDIEVLGINIDSNFNFTLEWRHSGAMASQITGVTNVYSFVQEKIKENTKAPRHWPLWGEFTGERRIPLTKGQ